MTGPEAAMRSGEDDALVIVEHGEFDVVPFAIFVPGLAGAGEAQRKVVVAEQDASGIQARHEEIQAVERRAVEIDVDMGEGETTIGDGAEHLRNPALFNRYEG